MSDLIEKLSAPFGPGVVSFRIGSMNQDRTQGMALAYIDARDVQDRLNAACGPAWQVRFPWSSGNLLCCEIGVKIDDEWVWRGDGAGEVDIDESLTGKRREQQQDMAQKAAFSDSFKRAAVRWGIGRYLYDLPAPWVRLEKKNNTYIIPQSELQRLEASLPGASKQAKAPAARAAPKQDHGELLNRYECILKAVQAAESPKLLDEINKTNQVDLRNIRAMLPDQFEEIIRAAAERRETFAEAVAAGDE